MNLILSGVVQSLSLLPLVLGIYISYRVLKITDLTVDGTYVLGAAIFAKTIPLGVIPAMLLGILGGMVIGSAVSHMQRNNRISGLVAGILASFMLYSVNLHVLGRPNISLLEHPTLSSLLSFDDDNWIVPLGILGSLLILMLTGLLNSSLGLNLRAFGYHQPLLQMLSKPTERYRMFGLALSNGLAALSGALTAQMNGFADINMGFGVALISIGAVVIGGHILLTPAQSFSAVKALTSCLLGILLYFFCLNGLLHVGMNPLNLKLALGGLLFFSLQRRQTGSQT